MLKSLVVKVGSGSVRYAGSTVGRSAGWVESVALSRIPWPGVMQRGGGATANVAARATNWSFSLGMIFLMATIGLMAWSLQYRSLNNDRTPWEIAILTQITGF